MRRRSYIRLFAAMLAPATLIPQEAEYKLSADVDFVVLSAVVTDRRGQFVSGLQRENFTIFEDGKPQEIKLFTPEDVPVTVGLVVDSSASMFRKRAETIHAAQAFLESSNPRDEVFVINFNDTVSFGLPAGVPFSGDVDELRSALNRSRAQGRTALYDALAAALRHVRKGSSERKALLFFSDGGDNSSDHSLKDILDEAGRSQATIYTVGLYDANDEDRNPRVLKRLAHLTGGVAFLPPRLGSVADACRRIAQDLRNQYTIGYAPSRRADGAFRNIRVTASAPGRKKLEVRTRSGYLAAEP